MFRRTVPYRLHRVCKRCQSTSVEPRPAAGGKETGPNTNNQSGGSSINYEDDSGYMLRRLAQLAEESRPFKDDPKAGQPYFPPTSSPPSSISFDLAVNEQKEYEYKHQREIAIATKIPHYADHQTRTIAHGKPWTGEEHLIDTAHRMLQDAHKPLAKTTALTGLATPKSKPKVSVSSRLSTAREKSLDYKLNPQKRSTKDDQEELSGPTFKELYAERFTGISSMTNDFSAISSLATQRIEASIARGEFDVLPGRGEKTPVDPNLSSPYIDHTEYYLNNMLKRQGAAPVWIDRQGTVHSRTREFRAEAGRSWLTHAVHVVTDAHPGTTTASQAARRRLISEIRADFRTHAATTARWKTKHARFHAAAVRDLNSAVRSYNLQAPSAARRGYLDVTTELDAAIDAMLAELDIAVDKYVHGTEAAAAAKAQEERDKKLGWHQVTLNELPSLSGLLSPGKGSAAADNGMPLPMELPPEKDLMKNLFKNLFKVENVETLTLKKKGWR